MPVESSIQPANALNLRLQKPEMLESTTTNAPGSFSRNEKGLAALPTHHPPYYRET